MVRTCIIDTGSNMVVNIIDYDKVPKGTPPGHEEGMIAVASAKGQIGWMWDGIKLQAPPVDAEMENADRKAARKASALAALSATDAVALRCFKAGTPYPAEWRSHTEALRAVLSADEPGELPSAPAYPIGS